MARTSRRSRRTSPLHLPGAFDLFTPSKELILRHIWIFGPLYAVLFIFWIHIWIWAPDPGSHGHHYWTDTWSLGGGSPGNTIPTFATGIFIGFSFFWLLIVALAGTAVQIMAQAAQLDAVEHRRLDFEILWKSVKKFFWPMLALYFVMSVIIGIGLFLLIVPGVILMRRYIFAPYILLEKNVGVWDALEKSAALSRLNTGSVYGILGVMLLIALVTVIPVIGGLASFVLGALYSMAPALRYQQLKRLAA
ncbi:MAG TPA: YciC family protein [Candidatus Saccharimonadales bacterium]|nr:YciC family protein [Candidatus Saccharimonadales bacterium]